MLMRVSVVVISLCLLLLRAGEAIAAAQAPTLVVQLPPALKASAAIAEARSLKLSTKGTCDENTITFANLLPDTAYDIQVTLVDGSILQGVDMGWYDLEPAKGKEPLDEDDYKQITEMYFGHEGFENKRNLLRLNGTHERATLLAELIRDKEFHSDKGGEIIWRVELWYFKNQHGGWEKIAQQNKVLRRERFTSKPQYDQTVGKLKWEPELGGIRIGKDEGKKTVTVSLEKKAFKPAAAKEE